VNRTDFWIRRLVDEMEVRCQKGTSERNERKRLELQEVMRLEQQLFEQLASTPSQDYGGKAAKTTNACVGKEAKRAAPKPPAIEGRFPDRNIEANEQ
jgi:hypothetical protein